MESPSPKRLSTGVPGLDEILRGGLIPGRAYLVRGGPGTGKTMLGLHFLTAGASKGERTLFISLEEPEHQIRQDAHEVGMDLIDVDFLDLTPATDFFTKGKLYDIFAPAEVELEPISRKIIERIEALAPSRVFLDVISQFRFLSVDVFQFRRQVLSFMRFLRDKRITLLMSSEGSLNAPDDDLLFLSDGIIQLDFSQEGRGVQVTKSRGADFRSGRHSMRLTERGMEVYPRLVPELHGHAFALETISSGLPELDVLLHGGLERGTVSIVTGPCGVGKTTLGLYFMKEAARRGERSVVYSFEERVETLLERSEAVNVPVREMIDRGTLAVVQVEPMRYSPDEFWSLVRQEVEQRQARIIMLDSLAGYGLCMQGQRDLAGHVHALCAYLRNMGVSGILVNEVQAITGVFRATGIGISYLTDNIIFLRYLELHGSLRRAIGVLKKRTSGFENTMREIEITEHGLKVGEPLISLRGLLSGMPEWVEGGGNGKQACD